MNTRPRAWVLNLDAESELEVAGAFTPDANLRGIVAREQRRLLGNLVTPGDLVLAQDGTLTQVDLDGVARPADAALARGLEGVAWSPTPRALARLEVAGARPAESPAVRVLRAVNARPFAARVRAPLAEGSFTKHVASDIDEALALIARPTPDGWLVRRSFGAAGRGRRRIATGTPSAAERAWLDASLRLGPLVVEPWVRIAREYTRSGWVRANGEVVISAPCFQATTREGAWTRSELAERGSVSRADDARLEEAAATAGAALARSGYFGPFGIDAFRHLRPDGAGDALNPMSEINARFTMDWATAMPARARGALASSVH